MKLWKLTRYSLQRADDLDLNESFKFLWEKLFPGVFWCKISEPTTPKYFALECECFWAKGNKNFPFQENLMSLTWVSEWNSLSCIWLCDPMDYTGHGILQARTLEWVTFPFSSGSSQPRDRTQVSHVAGGFFISWATREAP